MCPFSASVMAFHHTTRKTIRFLLVSVALLGNRLVAVVAQNGQLVKMELEHLRPVGHARSDPIISQTCTAGHVHSFYGPMELHPDTSYDDLLAAESSLSTSEVVENKSLYWHPTVYEYEVNASPRVYKRVFTKATTYYRWDNSVQPLTEEFPPGFRYIVSSTDQGQPMFNMYSECCIYPGGVQDCRIESGLNFPDRPCVHLDIVLGGPTCWDGVELGDTNDHKSHMAFTVDGTIQGDCPSGFNHRVPQVQLFMKIEGYRGSTANRKYRLSNYDGSGEFHWDFLNGWEEGVLQNIIENCEPAPNQEIGQVNPPVTCTPRTGDNRFLTQNNAVEGKMCDRDARDLILDERTDDIIGSLPKGSCTGNIISKSWESMSLQVLPSGDICDSNEEEEDDDYSPPAPTPSPVCSDDCDFTFKLDNFPRYRGCSWLTKNRFESKKRKEKYCGRAYIRSKCPATCDNSCNNDSTFTFTLKNFDKEVDCKWLHKNRKQLVGRQAKYCGDAEISSACSSSCGRCNYFPTSNTVFD